MTTGRKIATNNVYPPIPTRECDWCAWYEDEGEEAGRYGWGSSEAAAVADLHRKFGDGNE